MNWAQLKKHTEVKGHSMAWAEQGEGPVVLFIHGNPTSSYLWRNIMPAVADKHRCVAPDLIGMGDSAKLPNSGPHSYTFVEHREYLDGLIDQIVGDEPVFLVVHDWGSALGFDWARRHPDQTTGICYMEAIVRALGWDEFNQQARPVFEGFRSSAGEEMVLQKNLFVERVLPGSILRKLSEDELDEYRRPFLNAGEDRRPTLSWPRQIPLDGKPEDVVEIVDNYAQWMSRNELPKLFIDANPGAILIGPARDYCRQWKNQQEVTVSGSHFIQEDSADDIGRALREFLEAHHL